MKKLLQAGVLWGTLTAIMGGCGGDGGGAPEDGGPPTRRLQPADLVYQGAFRLPAHPEGRGWEWEEQP